MRVLLAPLDIAGQARMTAIELEKLGHTARFFDGYSNYLGYEHEKGQEFSLDELPALKEFDVFDIFFGAFNPIENTRETFKPLQFIHHFCGTDVRQLDIAQENNPYAVVKGGSGDKIRERIKKLATLTDHCTIMDEELRPHVEPFFEHVHIIPRMVDVEKYAALAQFSTNGSAPIVTHAPTSTKVKGTEFVIKAAEDLGSDIEFLLVAGMQHKVAERIYAQSDILISQLNLDSYGVFAIEGMAMGKVVITYLTDEMRKTYPENPPIVSATRETLRDVLADVVSWSRKKRQAFGKRAQRYAKKYHSPEIVVPQIVEAYESL